MLFKLINSVLLLSILTVSSSFESWEDILSADLTCCPQHTSAGDCSNEGASDCQFIDSSSSTFLQDLATAEGSHCLGVAFVACKVDAGAVDACCAPGCVGISPPAAPGMPPKDPSDGAVPDCFFKSGATTKAATTAAATTRAATTRAATTKARTTKAATTTASPTSASPTSASPTSAPTTSDPTSAPTTPAPTSAPTTPAPTRGYCEIGTNYAFEGISSSLSGDPHTKMWNGNNHDFQGQPLLTNAVGNLQNQFYYIAQCANSDIDLPFALLGTHFNWGTRDVAGIDYFTFILYDDNGDKYYVYISSSMHGYALDGTGVSSNYDFTSANGNVEAILHNVPTLIGSRFSVTVQQVGDEGSFISCTILIDGIEDNSVTLWMSGQMGRVTDSTYSNTRYRMHWAQVMNADAWKCATCGLFGDYTTADEGNEISDFQACDGTFIEFRSGWDDDTPEAYDVSGWTYERNYYDENCGDDSYDPTKNTDGLVYTDPCDATIVSAVETACAAIVTNNHECCVEVIGLSTCEERQEECNFDACVIATDNGGTQDDIDTAADLVLGAAIEGTCSVPNIGDLLDEGNLITGTYLGCYQDKGTRAMTVLSWNLESVPGCISLCDENDYSLAGVQYNHECFCSNDFDTATQYGEIDGVTRCNKGDNPGAYGSRGGGWAISLYRIISGGDKHKERVYFSQIDRHSSNGKQNGMNVLSNEIKTRSLYGNITNGYVQIGVVGTVGLLITAAVYAYKKRNKDDKYMPIH